MFVDIDFDNLKLVMADRRICVQVIDKITWLGLLRKPEKVTEERR